jgi:hypothetical protein
MKALNNADIQQISGGIIHCNGQIAYVPSTGIPDNYYKLIDSTYDQFFSGKIDVGVLVNTLINVPVNYLDQYILNIENAFVI